MIVFLHRRSDAFEEVLACFVADDRLLHRRRDALEEVLAGLVALADKLALDGRRVGRQVGPGTAVLDALGRFWGNGTGFSRDFGHQVGPGTAVWIALEQQFWMPLDGFGAMGLGFRGTLGIKVALERRF